MGRELHERIAALAGEGTHQTYAQDLLSSLAEAVTAAETAVQAAYEANTLAKEARDDHKRAALDLDDKLISFRGILKTVIGSKHRDYRMLLDRAPRTTREEELDQLDPAQAPDAAASDNDNGNDTATDDEATAETGTD